jgi:intracellular sulfur oxidation DsrE/DsrF family protein
MAQSIDDLLTENTRPEGVVFEVVSKDGNLLRTLLPRLLVDIERLRSRYEDLPVVVVSHGKEQFALLSKQNEKEAGLQDLVRQMVNEKNIDVHVCGTHAERYGYLPEDFPEYVDVSAEGPATINDYRDLGYSVIRYR